MNGYGAVYANDEATNIPYVVCFTYFSYTLQEDMEWDINQLVSGGLVCNAIYTSHGCHKSQFYIRTYENKKCDCVNEHSCYSKSRRKRLDP